MRVKVKRNIFAFFNTDLGKKVVFTGAGVTTLSLCAANFLPQSVFIDYYKQIFQCYQNGNEIPVPVKIFNRLEIAFEKLNVPTFERKLIKPFSVYGFDIIPFGSTKYRFGCAIGIPTTFSYDTIKDIDRENIRFRNEPVNWSTENGKLLESSLVLSQDEQIFGMCKAILQLQTHWILLNSIFPTISFLTIYTIGNGLNQKLNLYAKPLSVRAVMYCILGLFGVGMWSFMTDYNQVRYDLKIDEKLSQLGPEFINAGERYYEKVLNKNIALRELMNNDIYSAKGNENNLFRQKSLPITMRKLFFEMRRKELEKENVMQQ